MLPSIGKQKNCQPYLTDSEKKADPKLTSDQPSLYGCVVILGN